MSIEGLIHPGLTPRARVGAPPVTGHESPAHFAGYVSRPSVRQGDPLDVHVATRSASACFVDVYRVTGCVGPGFDPRLEHVERLGTVAPTRYAATDVPRPLAPGDCDASGCGWPATRLLDAVPDRWETGVYVLQFTAAASPRGQLGRIGEDAVLVVRPRAPRSPRLLQVGVATWAAYHVWANRSLYGGLDPDGGWHGPLRTHRVSLHRPGIGLGLFNQSTWGPGKTAYLWKFLEWAAGEGIDFDMCTGLDVDAGAVDLADYRLLVTVGHDEYWTGRQRDRVEAFVAGGGNAAFFGGNLAYWQVRVEDEGRAIVCFKRGPASLDSVVSDGEPLDPLYRDPDLHPDHDNSSVTVEFDSHPVLRPTAGLTGVSMRNDEPFRRADPGRDDLAYCGAAWWWEDLGGPSRPPTVFTIDEPEHWMLDGLDLEKGASFGADQRIVGFECDGLDVTFGPDGVPSPSGRDGVMPGTRIVAHADCRDWPRRDFSVTPAATHPEHRANGATLGGVVTLIEVEHAGGGRTVNAPTTDWVFALVPSLDYTEYCRRKPPVNEASAAARRITRNVLLRLSE